MHQQHHGAESRHHTEHPHTGRPPHAHGATGHQVAHPGHRHQEAATHHPAAAAQPHSRPTHPLFATLMPELQRALAEEAYHEPTPIQAKAIPPLLAGRDILGCAQTGTGKTAAFALPLLQHLAKAQRKPQRNRPYSLILAPTRELAAQIGDSLRTYGRHMGLTSTTIFGGVSQHNQTKALSRGVDIVVATPGRLLDLMRQHQVRLDNVEIFVLDEADRMLDMGFINDIRAIIAALPHKRQSLFFSATLPTEVVGLARTLVHDPVSITITPEQPAVEKIAQKIMFVDRGNKDELLARLLTSTGMNRVLVFTQMKHIANRVCERLERAGITAAAIHGNKSQSARTSALAGFKTGRVRVLVATDIAARGIDVDGITHVINYQLPLEAETYVHRIGRTARAGADGDAISFCCAEDRGFLRDIERLLRRSIPVDTQHPFHSETARNATGAAARPPPRGQRQQRHGGGHGSKPRRHGGGSFRRDR